ncbi:MAG TPA: EamA/RhaT family transporter [Elusimicrobia bacterium]|nr:EamA/RhaT family transporter [Elusimicrobiota bacterium]
MRRRLLDLGLLYCSLIWGATFFLVKDSLAQVDPVTLVAYRFLISAAVMLPWVVARPRPGRLLKEGLILGALLMILYVSQTAGLKHTTASNSAFITGLFVFFVPLFLLLFLRKPPAPGQWAAVGLAVAGLWLLTGGVGGVNRGDVLTLLAAVTYAAHVLVTDLYVRRDADLVLLAFHQFWFCGVACLIMALAAGSPLTVGTPRTWGTILFLALFPNVIAFYVQMVAQKETPPLKVSLIFSLEPVFAALFAWTIGGEAFAVRKAAGGLLILSGMVLGEVSRLSLAKGRRQEVLPV